MQGLNYSTASLSSKVLQFGCRCYNSLYVLHGYNFARCRNCIAVQICNIPIDDFFKNRVLQVLQVLQFTNSVVSATVFYVTPFGLVGVTGVTGDFNTLEEA